MIQTEYWNSYYQINHAEIPSQFAQHCVKLFKPVSTIIDVGCGNGRDTWFFRQHGHIVIPIDGAICKVPQYIRINAKDFNYADADVVYARWFLHAVNEKTQTDFLQKAAIALKNSGLLCIECRSDKDTFFNNSHYRRPINRDMLQQELLDLNLEIVENEEARGFSPLTNNDPLLIRMIARKKWLSPLFAT